MSLARHDQYAFDDFELQPSRRALLRRGEKIAIAPKTFEVLLCLVQNAGRVVLKEELLKAVWPDSFVEESNLTQHIFWLRKALGDKATTIVTVPGRGYEFTGKVTVTSQSRTICAAEESVSSPSITVRRSDEAVHIVVEETHVNPPEQPVWKRTGVAIAAVVAVAAIAATLGAWHWSRRAEVNIHQGVVLADFENNTGDKRFDQVLTQALKIDLEQSPFVDVLSDGEVVSTLQMMSRKPDTPITPSIAREICERTNRQVVLSSSLSNVGGEYLLLLEATDCRTTKKVAAAKAEASSPAKVLAALDAAAGKLRAGLGESAKSVERYEIPIVQATTPSLDALEDYSIAVSLNAQGKDSAEIIPFLEKAIELDPQFAMAYSALGMRYYNAGEQKLATANFAKALALSDHVSAKEKLIIQAHYYSEGLTNMQEGIRIYKMWTAAYPRDFDPWIALANMYFQLGEYGPSIDAGREALKLQPDRSLCYGLLTIAYMRANRFAEAKAAANAGIQHGFDTGGLHWPLYFMAWQEQDQPAIARELQWADNHSTGGYGRYFTMNLASADALLGKMKLAQGLFAKAYEKANLLHSPQSAAEVLEIEAEIQMDFGQIEAARATVERIVPEYADEPTLVILKTRLGDLGAAEKYLAVHGKDDSSTFHTYINIPQVKAVLAMQQNRPQDAIAALEPTRPYELCGYETIAFRADAYMQAHQPQMAIIEYKKILANPGIDPIEAPFALYRLRLARAYAAAGDSAAAHAEYEAVLQFWKDGDPDVPLLKKAREEYANLR